MQFDITIIRQDRTDLRPINLRATRGRLLFYFFLLLGLPVFGFCFSFFYLAPNQLGEDVAALKFRTQEAESMADAVGAQTEALTEENTLLRDQLNSERQQRAELEAKITIVETARQEVGDKVTSLEDQVLTLQRSVQFYEQFMKPANEQAPMQCFNMEAELLKDGQVSYGVNFMKNDRKNKDSVSFKVVFRVLAGSEIAGGEMPQSKEVAPTHERKAKLTRDTRLTGKFKPVSGSLPEGLRLLDVTAYDKENDVLAHCWKAF